MGFKDLQLRKKLAVLLIPSGLIVCLLTAYFFYNTSESLISRLTLQEQQNSSQIMKKLIDDLQSKALATAKIFAANAAVKEAYSNIDEAAGSEYLKLAIKPTIDAVKSDPAIKDYQIHYHKAPAKSFLRSWTKKRFDDLSSFRQTILEVYNTKNPVKAIEFGVGGFAIRGIAPITIDGEYRGSVEFLFEMKDVLNLMTSKNSKSDMFNIVSSNTAEKALKPEQIKEHYKQRIADYYLSEPKCKWVKQMEILDTETLNKINTSNDVVIKNDGSVIYVFNPVFDIHNQKIGFIVIANNNEDILAEQQNAIVIKIVIIAALLLVFIGLIFYFIDYFILRSMREVIRIANQVAKGDFTAFK